jgi:hypothetical protein
MAGWRHGGFHTFTFPPASQNASYSVVSAHSIDHREPLEGLIGTHHVVARGFLWCGALSWLRDGGRGARGSVVGFSML